MKLIVDVPEENYKEMCEYGNERVDFDLKRMIQNGTPIPDNATNGDVIKAMFGDKVSKFMGYVRIMAKVGNWFNEGVVAEFDKDWWNAPYQKGGKE